MKHALGLLLIPCLLCPSLCLAEYGELRTDSGLVGLWHLNGNATDSSGSGNNGTASGATAINAGKFGGAYSFDGTNDYISVAHSTSLNITSSLTIAFWIKVDTPSGLNPGFPDILSKGTYTEAYSFYGGCYYAGTDGYTFVLNNGGTYAFVESATNATGNWDFVVGVKSGTTGSIYVNGKFDGSATVPSSLGTTTTALTFSTSDAPIAADMDEIAIWNRALSAQEIQRIYAMQKGAYGIME